jgi:hypothetical protein
MQHSRVTTSFTALALLECIGVPRDAFAYVDPNSAGLIFQIFFPLILAVILAWRWLRQTAARVLKRLSRGWID